MPATYTDNGDGTLTVTPDGASAPIVVADTPGIRAHLQAQNPSQSDLSTMQGALGARGGPGIPLPRTTPPTSLDSVRAEASGMPDPRVQYGDAQRLQAKHQAMTWTPEAIQQANVQPQPVAPSTAQPAQPQAAPSQARIGANTAELENALAQEARDQSQSEKDRASALHDLGVKQDALGAAPQPKPVDPSEYYANIGHAFGAHSPVASRLIGGIVMGLFSGLGEIGGALAHRANAAQEIINQSMEAYIASQNQNNALTRQQWADQRSFLTDAVANKMQELAASANSQDVMDKMYVQRAQLRLANANALYQNGSLKPEAAEKIGRWEEAREAYQKMMEPEAATDAANASNGAISSLGTSAWRAVTAHVPGVETQEKAFDRSAVAVRNRIIEMLQATDKAPREGSAYQKEADTYIRTHWDGPETIAAKKAKFYELLDRANRIQEQTARGIDPTRQYPASFQPR